MTLWVCQFVNLSTKNFLCLNDQAYYCLIHFYRIRSTRFWQWFSYPNYPTTCFDLSWAMPHSEKQKQKQETIKKKNIQNVITNKNSVKTLLKINQFHEFTLSQGYTPSQQKYKYARCLMWCHACYFYSWKQRGRWALEIIFLSSTAYVIQQFALGMHAVILIIKAWCIEFWCTMLTYLINWW